MSGGTFAGDRGLVTELSNVERCYVLLTRTTPKGEYRITDDYTLRTATPNKRLKEAFFSVFAPDRPLQSPNFLALQYVDESSYGVYRDLVVFHSFVSAHEDSYMFAEGIPNPYYDATEILPVHHRALSSAALMADEDYESFFINVFTKEDSAKKVHVNYGKAFELFSDPKNKRLHDLIALYVFASGLESVNTIYINTNLAVAFYVTILEAMIEKPAPCSNVLPHCDWCNRDNLQHDSVFRTKQFADHYGDRFRAVRDTRHGAVHDGIYFDMTLALSAALGENTEEKRANLFDFWDKVGDLQLTARRTLVESFMDLYTVMG